MLLMARQRWIGLLSLLLFTACTELPESLPNTADSEALAAPSRPPNRDTATEPSFDRGDASMSSDTLETDSVGQRTSDVAALDDGGTPSAEDTLGPADVGVKQDTPAAPADVPAPDSSAPPPGDDALTTDTATDTSLGPAPDAGPQADVEADVEADIEADTTSEPLCGDGLCADDEAPASCPSDCPALCGDGACTGEETSVDCPADCEAVLCEPVGAPSAVSPAPHPGTTPGVWETTNANGFTDDYLVRADGELKVGIRRDWGATIIFFGFSGDGPGTNTTNTIDSHDTGREVQVAFYDAARIVQGCAYDASCQAGGGPCANSITFLGWNPVQGGNECNQGSGTEWVSGEAGVLTSETIPLFWNPDWQSPGCDNGGCSDPVLKSLKSDVVYTQALRWVSEHVVEMTMSVTNTTAVDHPTTLQEFPTLYATFGHQGTPNLNVILDATGAQIAIDQPANDGFFVKEFDSPGGWAALQNSDQTYGVGLYYENELGSFQGWQKAGVFNNIRSKFPFGIPAFSTVHGRAYLVLGGFGTIGAEVADLQTGLAPFGSLESPGPDANIDADTMTVSGWALDNRGVTELRVHIDGQQVASTTPNLTREDVCLAWPLYPGCPQVGFEVNLDVSTLSPCPHLLEIEALDTDGNARVIARHRIYVGGSAAPPATCGDAVCGPGEAPTSCPEDCAAVCGDGACTAGESSANCAGDCPPTCGDGVCSPGETCDPDCGAAPPIGEQLPIHRYLFSDGGDDDHMFGLSESAPDGYDYEGLAFHLYASEHPGLVPLYQSYCAACTDHLQGQSATEGQPSYSDHTLLGYCGAAQSADTPTLLQRVYSAERSDHFMTTSAEEVSAVQAIGYVLEGTCWVP
jgi:hypothetical protein